MIHGRRSSSSRRDRRYMRGHRAAQAIAVGAATLGIMAGGVLPASVSTPQWKLMGTPNPVARRTAC